MIKINKSTGKPGILGLKSIGKPDVFDEKSIGKPDFDI